MPALAGDRAGAPLVTTGTTGNIPPVTMVPTQRLVCGLFTVDGIDGSTPGSHIEAAFLAPGAGEAGVIITGSTGCRPTGGPWGARGGEGGLIPPVSTLVDMVTLVHLTVALGHFTGGTDGTGEVGPLTPPWVLRVVVTGPMAGLLQSQHHTTAAVGMRIVSITIPPPQPLTPLPLPHTAPGARGTPAKLLPSTVTVTHHTSVPTPPAITCSTAIPGITIVD